MFSGGVWILLYFVSHYKSSIFFFNLIIKVKVNIESLTGFNLIKQQILEMNLLYQTRKSGCGKMHNKPWSPS